MSIEYILFGIDEMKDMKKSLLTTQLSTLNSQQHLHNYKKLRGEEMSQKVKLKSLIDQFQAELQVLKSLLPESSYAPTKHEKTSHFISHLNTPSSSPHHIRKETQQKTSLESEIDAIKAKLQMLQ